MGHQHGRGFIVFRHGGRNIHEHIVSPTRVTSSFHRNRLLILIKGNFQKKILRPAGPQVSIFGRRNKYSSRQKLHLTINRIPEKNILYLALKKKNA